MTLEIYSRKGQVAAFVTRQLRVVRSAPILRLKFGMTAKQAHISLNARGWHKGIL